MKAELITKVCSSGVLKKLWSYIKQKSNCITIVIKIKMECDERKNKTGELDVEVKCKTKTELIDSIAAGARDAIDAGTKVLIDLMQQTGMDYEQLIFSL